MMGVSLSTQNTISKIINLVTRIPNYPLIHKNRFTYVLKLVK